ncbi:hypothetical protein HPB51_027263 [Rhipicephalus microplus]|uniref:Serpin domain-containing protein n=1 Tax=Rhipicephalus microplus TaxID=6941 RepID=A0A9J6D0K2_RHIMP|nr:hypothetical protein HPB51_027263 [Rhipicephalus microplus]
MAPEMSGCLLHFAVDVCRKLQEGGDTRNLLVSPLLLAGMLVMLLHGCATRTCASAAALGKALHVHWAPFCMARAYDHVAGATLAPFRRPRLHAQRFTNTIFMALFHDDSVPLTRSYYQMQDRLSYLLMRRNFAHDAEQCRFSMDALAHAVSSYSFKPGVDVFPRCSVDEHSLVVLLSWIRLEGSWKHSFQQVSGGFHETPEATVPVSMMRHTGSFRTCRSSELEIRDFLRGTVLELPHENRDVSLVILLPQRLDGLAALEKRVTAARLLHCVARLEEWHNMTVYLPRLKMKSGTDLGPVLKDMAVLHASPKGAVDSDNDVSPPPISRCVVSGTVTPPSASASCPASTTPEGALSPSSPSSPTADSSSGLNTSTALDEPSRSASQFVVDRPFMLLMLKRRPDVVLLLGTVKKLV